MWEYFVLMLCALGGIGLVLWPRSPGVSVRGRIERGHVRMGAVMITVRYSGGRQERIRPARDGRFNFHLPPGTHAVLNVGSKGRCTHRYVVRSSAGEPVGRRSSGHVIDLGPIRCGPVAGRDQCTDHLYLYTELKMHVEHQCMGGGADHASSHPLDRSSRALDRSLGFQ